MRNGRSTSVMASAHGCVRALVRRARVRVVLALACGASLLGSGLALGDGASPSMGVDPAIDARLQAAAAREKAEHDSPAARARRDASRSAYGGKLGLEAIEVAKRHFAQVLGQPLWSAGKLPAGEHVVRYVNDHSMEVARADGSGKGLVWSGEPLRGSSESGRPKPIDLSLAPDGDTLVPRNQAVQTRIGRTAGAGVTFGDTGVVMTPEVAHADAAATVDSGNVFYPDVATDTDLVVAPLPAGTETFTHLRSPASPEDFTLRFKLPAGARLLALHGGATGAEIDAADGTRLAAITPPDAFDSDGQAVPVSFVVDGQTLTTHVAHHGGDWAYPILVDPTENFFPWDTGSQDFDNWRVNSSVVPDFFPVGKGNTDPWGQGNGLYIYTHPNNDYGDHWWSEWYWQAYGDERVFRTEMRHVYHIPPIYGAGNCLLTGLRDGYWTDPSPWVGGDAWVNGGWIGGGSPWGSCGGVNDAYVVHCPRDCGSHVGNPHNRVVAQIYSLCCGWRSTGGVWPHIFLGGALIFYDEAHPDPPHWTSGDAKSPPVDDTNWYSATFPVTATAIDSPSLGASDDRGVGVDTFTLSGAGMSPKTDSACANDLRCPASWTHTISGSTSGMADGVDTVQLQARDALGNASTSAARNVNVDKTPPPAPQTTGLSSKRAVKAGTYDLGVSADDAHPVATVSGARKVNLTVDSVDAGAVPAPSGCMQNCTASGHLSFDANAPALPLASDDFAGTAATPLSAHQSTDGTSWTNATGPASGDLVFDASGRIKRLSGGATYLASATTSNPDVAVSADVALGTSQLIDSATVIARSDTSGAAYYYATVAINTGKSAGYVDVTIGRNVNGTKTVLASNTGPAVDPARLQLSLSGSALRAAFGSIAVAATDTSPQAIAAAGRVGVAIGQAGSGTPILTLDNFKAIENTPPRYTEGKHHFAATTTDGANNASPAANFDVIVDRTKPTITQDAGTLRQSQVGDGTYALDITAKDNRPTDANGTPVADIAGMSSLSVLVDGASHPVAATTTSDGSMSGTFTFNSSDYSEGSHTISVQAADDAGNQAPPDSFGVVVNHKPKLTITGGLHDQPVQSGRDLAINAQDSTPGVDNISIYIKPTTSTQPDTAAPAASDRVQASPCTANCQAAAGFDVSYRLPDAYPSGRYQVTVTASDGPNVSDERWIITVVRVLAAATPQLGLEHYLQYDDTNAGGSSKVFVNAENGNAVWHSVPIVNPGRGLSTVVNLTYNSLDHGGLVGDAVGRVPAYDSAASLSAVHGGLPGLSYGEAGVGFSVGISGPTRLNEPLGGVLAAQALEEGTPLTGVSLPTLDQARITMVDADGTQHTFHHSGDHWVPSDGLNLYLRRYRDGGSAASPVSDKWAMTRPDGVTEFFDSLGYLTSIRDRHGNAITYVYESYDALPIDPALTSDPCTLTDPVGKLIFPAGQAAKLCGRRVVRVDDPAKRSLNITYVKTPRFGSVTDALDYLTAATTLSPLTYVAGGAAGRIASISDISGREYKFQYDADGYLVRFVEAAGQDDQRSTKLEYEPAAGDASAVPQNRQLAAVDELRNPSDPSAVYSQTKLAYEPAPNSPVAGAFDAPRKATVLTSRAGGTKTYAYTPATGSNPRTFAATEVLLTHGADQTVATTTTELDAKGRPTKVTSPLGTATALTWNDAENKIASLTEAAGTPDAAQTTYAYDTDHATGSLTTKTEYPSWPATGDARTTTFGFRYGDGTYKSTAGGVNDAGKNEVAELSSIDNPKGGTGWTFGLNDVGDVTSKTDAKSQSSQMTYDAAGDLTKTTDELNNATTFSNFDATGQPQSVVDPRTNVWSYRYDARGNLLNVVDPRNPNSNVADGQPYTTSLHYDDFDRLVYEQLPKLSAGSNTSQQFVVHRRAFDRDGNTTSATNGAGATTTIDYTKADQPLRVTAPGAPDAQITGYAYDDAQRLIAKVAGKGDSSDTALQALRASQDAACTGTAPPTAVAYVTRYCLDAADRARAQIDTSTRAGDDPAHIASFAYDRRDNLIGSVDAARNLGRSVPAAISAVDDPTTRRLSYTYDKLDEKLSNREQPTETNASGAPVAPTVWKYAYDANGNQTDITHPAGDTVVTHNDYDQRDQLIAQTDPLGQKTCTKRRADEKVIAVTTPRGTAATPGACTDPSQAYQFYTTNYTYDENGALASQSIPYADAQYGLSNATLGGWKVGYSRDAVGNAQSITDARGHAFTNTFYDDGTLRSTQRPSFYDTTWAADATNPDPGQHYSDQTQADVQVATGGPQITQRPQSSSNAAVSGQDAQLPSSQGAGNFGAVDPQPLPDLLPQAGATTFAYDDAMRLTGVTDAAGNTKHISYFAGGQVQNKTWPYEHAASSTISHDFAYDTNGNLVSSQDGDANATTFAYDGYDQRLSQTAPGANDTTVNATAIAQLTRFAYDANGNLTSRQTPRGSAYTYNYAYTSLDQLASETDPASETWRYTYDTSGRRSADTSPRATGATNPQLYRTSYQYDNADQLKQTEQQTQDANGAVQTLDTTYAYNADGQQTVVTSPGAARDQNSGVAAQSVSTTFDGRGLPWQTVTGTGTEQRTTLTEYDPNGNLARTVEGNGVSNGAAPHTYDANAAEAPNADPTLLDSASEKATVRRYDDSDLLTQIRLPWNASDTRKFRRDFQRADDPLHRVTSIVAPYKPGDTGAYRTSYAYYATDWISNQTDATGTAPNSTQHATANPVSYDYTNDGLQNRWDTQGAGSTNNGRTITRTFWPDGQLKKRTATYNATTAAPNPAPKVYCYRYNANQALVAFVDLRAATTCDDAGTRVTAITRDGADRQARVNETWDTGKDTTYAYDATGNVTKQQTDGAYHPAAGTTPATYDGPDAKTTTYAYDSLNRETSVVVSPTNGATRVTASSRWPSGALKQRTKSNGTTDRWFYDTTGSATMHTRTPTGATAPVDAQTYSYDANGNRIQDERGTYTFNARDQLISWKRAQSAPSKPGWTTGYTLNGDGAITQAQTTNTADATATPETTTYAYQGQRLQTATTNTFVARYRYDDFGNVVRIRYDPINGTTLPEPSPTTLDPAVCQSDIGTDPYQSNTTYFCFDQFSRPVFSRGQGVTTSTYITDDGLDRRDTKKIAAADGSAAVYDFSYVGTTSQLSRETDKGHKRKTYDYTSQGEPLGQDVTTTASNGTTSSDYRPYATDANGSVVGLENNAKPHQGQIPTGFQYSYDPYGELQTTIAPTTAIPDPAEQALDPRAQDNPFRFEGFYYDSGVKTYDMHARAYEAASAHFLSADTFESAAGDQALTADALTENRYAFAGGNPVNNVEFDGHEPNSSFHTDRTYCGNRCEHPATRPQPRQERTQSPDASDAGHRPSYQKQVDRSWATATVNGSASRVRVKRAKIFTPGIGNDATPQNRPDTVRNTLRDEGWIVGVAAALYGGGKAGDETAPPVREQRRGGREPVLKGQAGVARARGDITAEGGEVVGAGEITIRTRVGTARVDLAAVDSTGEYGFVEVKNGPSAGVNSNQQRVFAEIRANGGVPVGARAREAGLEPGVPIGPTPVRVIHYGRP